MVIWSRWGIVLFLAIPAVVFPALALEHRILGEQHPSEPVNIILWGINALLLSPTFWLLNLLMERVFDQPKEDPRTGILMRPRRATLFYIPTEYWFMIAGFAGAVALIIGTVRTVVE